MQLQSFLVPTAWQVRNGGQSRRSSRSFSEEGWLAPVDRPLSAGAVLLIQFGHNDQKAEEPTRYNKRAKAFPQWLMQHVALARTKGAYPKTADQKR